MKPELTGLNDEQTRANRFDIVSRMADDLAHEIKNPLNSIVINLEVLKMRAGRGDTTAAIERATVVEQEARRLHHLLDRLLLLLRPDRSDHPNLALDQVLDELLPLVEAQVRLARNEFRTDCAATLFVPVDRDAFKFALLNLLMGAHELLGEAGGTLSLECRPDEAAVHFVVDIHRTGGAASRAGAQDPFGQAVRMAEALLGPAGGVVRRTATGAAFHLPRSGAG